MISDSSSSRTSILASMLNASTSKLVSATELLSSGLRILTTSDDAAGLSLSKKTAADGALYRTAMGNINSGQSLVNVAAAAINAKELVMTKLLELAQQATSSLLTTTQRQSLNSEAQLLKTEYERINSTASYNNRAILTNPAVSTTVQTGPQVNDRIQFTVGEDVASVSFNSSVYGTSFDGTFQARTTQASGAAGSSNASLAAADLNGDGNVDVVTSKEGFAYIHLGNGNGTFTVGVSVATNGSGGSLFSQDVQLGDVNGDGKLDIVATSYGAGTTGLISVLLGNGNGTFGAAVNTSITAPNYALTLGDFNGDGRQDVVTTDPLTATGTKVLISASSGNGTFTSIIAITGSTSSTTLDSADLNGDGFEDLIVGNSASTQQIYLGNGNGTFKAVITLADTYGYGITARDVNSDGVPDLVGGSGSTYGVFIGNGNGTFKSALTFTAPGTITGLAVGDVNKDGKLDIISRNNNSGVGLASVLLGNGNGTFKTATTQPGGTALGKIVAADVNNDGASDGLVAAATTLSIYRANSSIGTTIANFDLLSVANASAAATTFQSNLNVIGIETANVTATKSRLSSAFSLANSMALKLEDASSLIRNGDQATLLANYLSSRIRADASSAVFAQANQFAARVGSLIEATLGKSSTKT